MGVYGGYYADPEQDCQAYHVCLSDPLDQDTLYPVSFLCPNGTIFNQQIFVCDWWFNVDCEAATSLYGAVEGAFGVAGGEGGEGEEGYEYPVPQVPLEFPKPQPPPPELPTLYG